MPERAWKPGTPSHTPAPCLSSILLFLGHILSWSADHLVSKLSS